MGVRRLREGTEQVNGVAAEVILGDGGGRGQGDMTRVEVERRGWMARWGGRGAA